MRRSVSDLARVAQVLSLSVALGAALPACIDEAAPPPCTSTGECLAGFQCNASNVCETCPNGLCGPRDEQDVGTGGGLVCHRDGVCIEFPEGALDARVTIVIRRPEPQPSTGVPTPASSKVYEISPVGLPAMTPPAVVRFPVTGVALDQVAVFRLDDGGAVELTGTPVNGRVEGRTDRLGSFVVARKGPQQDGGVLDAEVDSGMGSPDAEPDGGVVGVDAEPDGGVVGVDAEPDGGVVSPDAEADSGVGFPDAAPDVGPGFPDAAPDVGPGFPDATPVFPDAAPVFPDAAPVFPDAAPVFPDAAPVFPDAAPVFPDAAPVFPDAAPVFPDAAPVFPDAAPVFPDAAPVFPDAAPVFPDADPVFPDADPVFPDADPVFPDADPPDPDAGVVPEDV